ncbi:MAG: hypothetical protein H0V80_03410 [Acidobacteria bacterium]|nr:hypothetical protein [Acidobacteriota bacterium]
MHRAAALYGTPCYVTRVRPVETALAELERRVGPGVRSWLSFKTHPLPRLLEWWTRSGRGVEVVSESEFATARALGCDVDQLLVNGVAKHSWLGRHPIEGLRVHFDSATEVDALMPLALRCRWRVGVRVHAPDERDRRDDRFGGQFGMTTDEAVHALHRLLAAGADVLSLHFHLGQHHHAAGAYRRAVEHAARVSDAAAFRPRFLDCGGGLPGPAEAAPALAELIDAIGAARSLFAPQLEELWLENGRFVTEQASALAVRVIDAKVRPDSRYLICDGGRTNHALAADAGPHPLLVLPARTGPARLTTVCGPTCMTDDVLARVPLPSDVAIGDVLVWLHAGAYHLPWETRFSQGLCAVAWCDHDEDLSLAREREQPEEWVRRARCDADLQSIR